MRAPCLKHVGNDKSNVIRVVRHTCGMCIAYPKHMLVPTHDKAGGEKSS